MRDSFPWPAAVIALLLLLPSAAAADVGVGGDLCGQYTNHRPALAPTIDAALVGPTSDAAFGCLAWQSFIYLNWPVRSGAPGVPDSDRRLGDPGPTVWETYKQHDQVFRPQGGRPKPWGQPDLSRGAPRPLKTTQQAGGGHLVDHAGKRVLYEMLINRDEFNYIVENRLYDPQAQLAFAKAKGIVLPAGASPRYGPVGAIELKAAWKVLSAEELAQRPRRFHTAEAVLGDGSRATVGLVGFHLNQRVAGFAQGVWATFVQIDSAPLVGAPAAEERHYSFHDPDCGECAVNTVTDAPRGTQVEQVFPAAPSVAGINAFVRELLRDADPESPWQFYDLLGVQWPVFALGSTTPLPQEIVADRASVPLLIGHPSTQTLVNPVLETFRQDKNVSCLGCHADGATALTGASGPLAADYSFLFRHAVRQRRN